MANQPCRLRLVSIGHVAPCFDLLGFIKDAENINVRSKWQLDSISHPILQHPRHPLLTCGDRHRILPVGDRLNGETDGWNGAFFAVGVRPLC